MELLTVSLLNRITMKLLYIIHPRKYREINQNVEFTTFQQLYRTIYNGTILNGVCPDYKGLWMKFWFPINCIVMLFGIIVLLYSLVVDINKGDYPDATRQLSIICLFVLMEIKMANLHIHKKTVKSIIERMNEDYHNAKNLNENDKDIVKEHVLYSLWLQDAWMVLCFLCGQIFGTSAIVFMLYSYFVKGEFKRYMIFWCYLPFVDDIKFNTPIYELFALYEIYANIASTVMYMSFDAIMPIFILHICGQLEIVNCRLLNLYKHKSSPVEIQRKLKGIINHLQITYKFSEDVNTMCGNVYLLIFMLTPLLVTPAAFQIFSCLENNEIPYEFAIFFVAATVHTLIPSYYGDKLIEKSLSVASAAYESLWETTGDISNRKTLIIIIMRAQKPLQIFTMTSAVSLRLFCETAQLSWTIFNLMLAFFK